MNETREVKSLPLLRYHAFNLHIWHIITNPLNPLYLLPTGNCIALQMKLKIGNRGS